MGMRKRLNKVWGKKREKVSEWREENEEEGKNWRMWNEVWRGV